MAGFYATDDERKVLMKNRQQQNGSAVVIMLGIISIVSVVCGMLGFTATQQMRAAQITRENLKARLIAESGLNKAYLALKHNFAQIATYTDAGSFGDGTYTIETAVTGYAGNNRAQLISKGVCGMGRTVVRVDLQNKPVIVTEAEDERFFALDFDLLAGSNLDLKGNFFGDFTKIHANGAVNISGSANIDAKIVSSTSTVNWKGSPANVTKIANAKYEPILNTELLAAMAAFKSYAVANGAVYASGSNIPTEPPGGVAYCTGSDAGWSGEGTGCFIFEGSFSSKHINITAVDGYPALIVLSVNAVQFNAGTEIRGALLLPSSSLKLNGQAQIYGSILVGQTMTGNGTADLYAGTTQGFSLPPVEKLADYVMPIVWH